MAFSWQVIVGLVFLLISGLLYFLQILLFNSPRDTFFYFFQDVAFIPIQVLIVSFIINQLLEKREKENFYKKLNMVIGVFFSEIGFELIKYYRIFDKSFEKNSISFSISDKWSDNDYKNAAKIARKMSMNIKADGSNLILLKKFLLSKRDIMLRILENQNLLEHESFSDMLLAISHLTEELEFRKSLENLTDVDRQHIEKDLERAFIFLLEQYFMYMKHIKNSYPYLYSLYLRINIFTGRQTAEVY